MTASFIIRPAARSDYAAIIVLLHELANQEQGLCRLDEATLEKQVASNHPPLCMYVAVMDCNVVGCLLAYSGFDVLSATCGWHLSDVVVQQSAQGKGIGSALMAHLAKEGVENGLEWISWTVLSSNNVAKGFYERAGASHVNVEFMAMGLTAMHKLVKRHIMQEHPRKL